ncbi:hypothetical protein C5167_047538 [Papaver somniferum]|uniref:Uncharacterized protein n=1 Tax=Papaver somniferum TaxID=3469 RepID=A0A4Y7LKW4_PAPSO|nr:hypothetical protein C5167_047538 [Papaver somniferum]
MCCYCSFLLEVRTLEISTVLIDSLGHLLLGQLTSKIISFVRLAFSKCQFVTDQHLEPQSIKHYLIPDEDGMHTILIAAAKPIPDELLALQHEDQMVLPKDLKFKRAIDVFPPKKGVSKRKDGMGKKENSSGDTEELAVMVVNIRSKGNLRMQVIFLPIVFSNVCVTDVLQLEVKRMVEANGMRV